MPLTGFLKIPDIDGELKAADHEDEIDVFGIEWSIEQPAAASVGSGRGRQRAVVNPLTVRKFYDASSPYIALAGMQGRSFDEVVISIRRDTGDAHIDYLVITLEEVIVSAYSLKDSEPGEAIEETVSLSFGKVNVVYTAQAEDHTAGDEHEIEFDIAAGA